ncbi:MAG: phage holin family protein [Burkholderiales bacterium]
MSEAGPARAESAGPSAGGTPPPSDDASVPPGIRDLLGRLAASLASAVDTRVQLAALEFAEERDRASDRLVLVLVAAIAAGLALLGLNGVVVTLLWERLGWVALLLPTLLWTAVAAVAIRRLSIASRREQRPVAATLAEFSRDRAFIVERFGKGPR